MAVKTTWGVREAFTLARDRYFVPIATDPELSGAEQALAGEAVGACDRAINALGVDDLWPQGQRNARYVDCLDKVQAMTIVDRSHQFSDPERLYNGCDLLLDAATAARDGLTTFHSVVSELFQT